MNIPSNRETYLEQKSPFNPLGLIGVIVLLLAAISFSARWYSSNITLPRYCTEPIQTLARVEQLLTQKTPAGGGDRKPYILAARLTFLIPRESDESLPDYLGRLHQHIDRQCR